MANEGSHVEVPQLPAELLQSICDLLTPNDILSFRLACTKFADISFDSYASCYMEEISCFFPDPARLRRLANIASQPHLANRIRTLYLSLDPYECKGDEINFVIPTNDGSAAFPDYLRLWQMEEVEHHCAQRYSLDLLSKSLMQLNPMRCSLHLDLGDRNTFRDHADWALNSQKVLAAIEKALYPIYDLNYVRPVVRSARWISNEHHRLYYTPYHSIRIDDQALKSLPAITALQLLIASGTDMVPAHDLESLDLIYWRWPAPISQITPFTGHMLSTHNWTRLKRITFVHIILPAFDHLFYVLRCCQNTLEILALNEVQVSSADGHEWKRLFEILSELPKLEHLLIRQLWWNRGNGHRVLVLDGKAHIGPECRESGHTSVKAALTQILQRGLIVRDGAELIRLW